MYLLFLSKMNSYFFVCLFVVVVCRFFRQKILNVFFSHFVSFASKARTLVGIVKLGENKNRFRHFCSMYFNSIFFKHNYPNQVSVNRSIRFWDLSIAVHCYFTLLSNKSGLFNCNFMVTNFTEKLKIC